MNLKNYILEDFKEIVITQFVAVITFGFAITAFYGSIYLLITKELFNYSIKEVVFLLLSFIGYISSFYLVKNDINLKMKIMKYLDFIITMFGFVLMFVPIIIILEQISTPNISYHELFIKNGLISLVFAFSIFFIKSIFKSLIK